jgi:YaiO family outer membrane protein
MRRAAFLLLLLGAIAAAGAEEPAADPRGIELRLDRTSLELRLGAQRLTAGYPSWREGTLLLGHRSGAHLWQAEISSQQRFGARGTYASIMDTYTIDPDWHASLALGAGDGAFFMPRRRIDAFLYRKLLADRSLVAFAGLGDYRAPDGHHDRSLALGAIHYFARPWVVQGGVRFNESRPGSVRTRQHFLAATYGRGRDDQWTARFGWGREGYLALGPGDVRVDFASREASLQWRRWIDASQGFAVSLEHYRSPFYDRSGVMLGYFVVLP